MVLGVALASTAKEVEAYTQLHNQFTGNIVESRKAVGLLTNDLEIMQAKNTLMTLGVELTNEQFNNLLKSLTKISSTMNITMAHAMDSSARALSRQSRLVADNVGVIVDAAAANRKWAEENKVNIKLMSESQKKLAWQAEFIRQLNETAESLNVRQKTFGGLIKVTTNALTNLVLQISGAINQHENWDIAINATIKLYEKLISILPKPETTVEKIERQIGETEAKIFQIQLEAAARGENVRVDSENSVFNTRLRKNSVEYTADEVNRSQSLQAVKIKLEQELAKEKERLAKVGKRTAPKGKGPTRERFEDPGAIERLKDLIDPVTTAYMNLSVAASKAAGAVIGVTETMVGWDNKTYLQRMLEVEHANLQLAESERAKQDALKKTNDLWFKGQQIMFDAEQQMDQMLLGALANFTAGLWDVADALISGEVGLREAMLSMTKNLLLGLAKQATVEAIMETARGIAAQASTWGVPNPKSIGHFAAAATFGTVAGAAGAAGLAASAMGRAAGGRGGDEANRRIQREQGRSPTVGRRQREMQAINLNVYLGEPDNPSAIQLMRKQLSAELARQAA
jgi:hypothetical protein